MRRDKTQIEIRTMEQNNQNCLFDKACDGFIKR